MPQQNPERIFLIINNRAGHRKGKRAAEMVMPFLTSHGCLVEQAVTQYPGHAIELASQASAAGFDLVVAIGGDGTANETAQGLIGTGTAMGIIPVGSGNGLALELGIPTNLRKSCQMLLDGITQKIDVCRINGRQFFATSGIGFDAHIAYKMNQSSSRGFLRYVQLAVKESLSYKPVNVRLKINGKSMNYSVFLVTFANASQYGNNIYIAPAASMADGVMDVVVVKDFNKLWLPAFAMALFFKAIRKLPFVDCYKASEIEIEWADTSLFHCDGELGQLNLPEKVTIEPQKIFVRCGI